MSNENFKDPYHYNPFYHDPMGGTTTSTNNTFPFFPQNSNFNHLSPPTNYMSFTDSLHGSLDHYKTLSNAFDNSCSSSQTMISTLPIGDGWKKSGVENVPLTPHSSVISSSSNEGGGPAEEDSGKSKRNDQEDEGDEKDNKVNKSKKKGEKKQRQPRFAFMTKSDIDNLEDGYRWRKYGQKAVKNSPFPRSYYRCTSQKCGVKKRVERSFEDPTTVVTTYEGQHNHHSPATLRGNAAGMLSPSLFAAAAASTSSILRPGFSQELFAQMLMNIPSNNNQFSQANTSMQLQQHHQPPPQHQQQQQQQLQLPDYGLLQDIFPSSSSFHKQEP